MDTVSRTKPRYATVKARNAAAIPEVLREFGAEPGVVLVRAGLDRDVFSNPENILPFAALGKLVSECVSVTGREDLGLRVGARTRTTGIGLTALVSMHSPTVRDALQVIAAGLKTSDSGGAVLLDQRGDVASVGYAVTAPDIESADQIVDGGMAIIFNMMRSLCGPTWRPMRVRLTRDQPRDRLPFSKFFEALVEFEAPAACMVFDEATLDMPVRDRDPEYASILAPLLEEAIASTPGDFVSAVKAVIRGQIGADALSRDSVCRALGLNARTFAHRLEAFGVTYSGLADEVRYEFAQGLLIKDKRIAEIAALLGFAEQSAFTRAFKAWSGTTPARWRAARKGEGASRRARAPASE